MKKLLLLAGTMFATATAGRAQDTPKAELSASYSFFRECGNDGVNFNGGSFSFAGNLNRWAGVVGDFGAYHASPSGASLNTYTFLVGPRFSYRKPAGIQPFVQVLVGGAHLTASAGGGWAQLLILPIVPAAVWILDFPNASLFARSLTIPASVRMPTRLTVCAHPSASSSASAAADRTTKGELDMITTPSSHNHAATIFPLLWTTLHFLFAPAEVVFLAYCVNTFFTNTPALRRFFCERFKLFAAPSLLGPANLHKSAVPRHRALSAA